MDTNTLVTHKKLSSLGIGCVSRIFKKKVRVNFGMDDVIDISPSELLPVDTSNCMTISMADARRISRGIEKQGDPLTIIIGNELKQYVGIGWVSQRVITMDDLKRYPRLVD